MSSRLNAYGQHVRPENMLFTPRSGFASWRTEHGADGLNKLQTHLKVCHSGKVDPGCRACKELREKGNK